MQILFISTLAAALAACATGQAPTLDEAGAARLAALAAAPESAGMLVYRGAVYPLAPPAAPQLLSYERRVQNQAGAMTSSHITRDASGEVVVAESARLAPGYELLRFDAAHRQAHYSGSVVANGRHLEFVLNQGGRISHASEDVSDPVVAGPSLHGFILHHWDPLMAGQALPVRMIVMAEKQTYGFVIRQVESASGRTAFEVTPSSWLVRLAVAPLRVEFDSTKRHVVRYQGRVPPMLMVDGKPRPLDARVDYTMVAAAYR